MKYNRRLGMAVCALACLVTFAACSAAQTDVKPEDYKTNGNLSYTAYKGSPNFTAVPLSEKDTANLATYQKEAENSYLTLYINQDNTFIAVADKRSGKVWYSNSPDLDENSAGQGDTKDILKSQLMVDYVEYQAFNTVNNYAASIKNKSFRIQNIDDGVAITYTFMESVTEKNSSGASDSSGGDQPTRKLFDITLEYKLDNESLIADIPLNKIGYSRSAPPLNITLLQDFGSSNAKEGGYIFVPDGSGALMNFDSKKTKSSPFITHVYGRDKTIDNQTRASVVQNACLPVFGLKDHNNAFLAIIEDGAAFATVNADPAGVLSSQNEVFPAFNIMAYQNVSIGDNTKSKYISFQKKLYQGSIRVRYAFLNDSNADYMGMASYYRQYLVDKKAITPLKSTTDIPLNLEMVGSIDKVKSFLGINYKGIEPLTTFTQAKTILQELTAKNIRNMNIRFTGWFNGGLNQQFASRLDVEGALGGTSGFKSLVDYTKQNNLSLFPNVNFVTTPSNSKGFNKYESGAKVLDQKDSRVYNYDPVTLNGTDYSNVITQAETQRLMALFQSNSAELGVTNLSVDAIGSDVFADYTEKNVIDRQTASNFYNSLLKQQKQKYQRLMVSGANEYAVDAADVVLNMPLEDSGYYAVDETIPFLPIVYHGYKDYSAAAFNTGTSYDDVVLKSIEYGALPFYQIMYADGSVTKNTDYSVLCSNNYGVWKDKIIGTYASMNKVLSSVYTSVITGHQKLANQVFETIYSNGTAVIVNYSDQPVTTGKGNVEAKGYLVLKGVK